MRGAAILGALLASSFAVGTSGCRGGPIEWERWGVPPLDASSPAELRRKVALWERDLFAMHISPEGLLLYRAPVVPHPEHDRYEDLADQACWSGYLLAALCFRNTVEPAPEIAALIRRVALGLRCLHDVTGTPGYIARSVLPARSVAARAHDPSRWRASPRHPGLWFRSDTSKDQYSGYVFGLTSAALLAPDAEVRRDSRALLLEVARHIDAGELEIRDETGETTRFGDLSPRVFGVPIGVNSAIVLAILRAPLPEGLDPDLARRFRGHARRARRALRPLHFELFGIRNYSNDLMATAAMLALGLAETHPERRAELRAALEPFLESFRGEGNALFVSLGALYGVRTAAEEECALRNLVSAPTDLRITAVSEDLYRDLPERWLSDRKGRPRARNALPLCARGISTFAWKTDPYVLDAKSGGNGSSRASGVDFVLAYWLGRYTGWIPAPEGDTAGADRTGT